MCYMLKEKVNEETQEGIEAKTVSQSMSKISKTKNLIFFAKLENICVKFGCARAHSLKTLILC